MTPELEEPVILGLDIGGTKVAVCVGDAHGRILASERVEGATQRDYAEALPGLVDVARRLVTRCGLDMSAVAACGVSAPGPLDIPAGIIEKSPNMRWEGVPVRDDLAARLGVPVLLENDANAGALAEWFFGVGRGHRDVIYLTMSTGIGGGIIANGGLVRGAAGNAGELGHAILDVDGPRCGCGMNGCFEAFCSGRNVAARLREAVGADPAHPMMTLPEVGGDPGRLGYETLRAAVRAGIPFAVAFWDDIALRMAQGLGLYMMVFNPEVIIVGTIFLHAGELLLEPVRRYLPRFAWPQMRESCRIALPHLGLRIGELAGISVALYDLCERGEWEPPAPDDRGMVTS
jgi:glucokinase